MNGFMRNLRIGTLGMAMVVLLVITAGLVVASSFLTMRSVTSITETWVDYEKGPAQKVAILNDMSSALGYGGMIHQLKNFVLRRDRPRIVKQITWNVQPFRFRLHLVHHRRTTVIR